MTKIKTKIWPQPKVVVIGGGTGVSNLLYGLKRQTEDITAIITVADDGGSTGKLRNEYGIIAPGDIRACLIALSNTQPIMEDLLKYRFDRGDLEGHSFGNLFITAMHEITGSFEKSIKELSNVLSITGKVLPVTLADVTLVARMADGTIVKGESKIPEEAMKRKTRIEEIWVEPELTYPLPDVLDEISQADLIVLGPGSLYTSIIPNLLVDGIVEEIIRSKARVVYVCNIMTQEGETEFYSVADHVKAIIDHSDNIIDAVVINDRKIDKEYLRNYEEENQRQVALLDRDLAYLKKNNIEIIKEDLIFIDEHNLIRHDCEKLSEKLISIL